MAKFSRCASYAFGFVMLVSAAGCGGGGGSSPTVAVTPVIPVPTAVPSPKATATPVVTGAPAAPGSATFTVYTANVDGQTLVSMAPAGGGTPDSTHAWSAAPGAYVIYPDNSIQSTDTTGSFDASQSLWTLAHAQAVTANPNASPELRIMVPASSTPAVPLYTAVLPINTFGSTAVAGAVPANFGDLVVVPSGAAMFDDEVRVFEAVGQDLGGGVINVAPAVQWSLQVPKNCPGPAGSLVVNPKNASIVTYHPPAAGQFVSACYDRVVASIANPTATVSASANALYFAPSQAVALTGKVVSGSGTPIPNGIVDVYGGSGVLGLGDFLALTNSAGSFVRNVPPLRAVTPFVENVAVKAIPSAAAFSVTPTNITVGPTGAHPAAVTLVEGAPFSNPYSPLPTAAFNVVNSYNIANSALLDVAFGLPNAQGVLPNCSISAYVTNTNGQSTVQACGGIVKGGGVYGGWLASVAVDPVTGANDFVFLEPAGGPGQHVLAVQTNITAYTAPNNSGSDPSAPACSVAAPCFSYAKYYAPGGIGASVPTPLVPANLPAGTALQLDGVYLAAASGTTNYQVNLIRNVYTGSFQKLGQPQRSHAEAFTYLNGATSVNFTDRWYNPLDQKAGDFSFSRAQTSTGYTFSGSGTQSFYRLGFPAQTVNYVLSAGTANLTPGPVTETYSVSSSATTSSPALSIAWSWAGLANVGSTATGVVTIAGQTTPISTFLVDTSGDVTLTGSANGGGIQQFPL